MSEPILLSYDFDGKGGGSALTGQRIYDTLESDLFAWVHLDVNHSQTRGWLEKNVSYLDPFIIEGLLADETRPRVTELGEGALIVLRGVNLNENADPEDMISIRLWIDEHRIISLQKRQLKAVQDIEEKILSGKGPENAGQFVPMLVSRLFDRMEPVLGTLDEKVDEIEEKILEEASISLRENIVTVRKQAIIFRRYMAPQRDGIGQLQMSNLGWLSDLDKRYLQESYNQVTRYVEDLDTIRERAQIIKDELANMLADKLNKNMYLLSVIAAIFLPLGFLTGLLGINIGGMPGAEYPYAFWLFSSFLALIVLIQIIVFKKNGWF